MIWLFPVANIVSIMSKHLYALPNWFPTVCVVGTVSSWPHPSSHTDTQMFEKDGEKKGKKKNVYKDVLFKTHAKWATGWNLQSWGSPFIRFSQGLNVPRADDLPLPVPLKGHTPVFPVDLIGPPVEVCGLLFHYFWSTLVPLIILYFRISANRVVAFGVDFIS